MRSAHQLRVFRIVSEAAIPLQSPRRWCFSHPGARSCRMARGQLVCAFGLAHGPRRSRDPRTSRPPPRRHRRGEAPVSADRDGLLGGQGRNRTPLAAAPEGEGAQSRGFLDVTSRDGHSVTAGPGLPCPCVRARRRQTVTAAVLSSTRCISALKSACSNRSSPATA